MLVDAHELIGAGASGCEAAVWIAMSQEKLCPVLSESAKANAEVLTCLATECGAPLADCTAVQECATFLESSTTSDREPTIEEVRVAGQEAAALFGCYQQRCGASGSGSAIDETSGNGDESDAWQCAIDRGCAAQFEAAGGNQLAENANWNFNLFFVLHNIGQNDMNGSESMGDHKNPLRQAVECACTCHETHFIWAVGPLVCAALDVLPYIIEENDSHSAATCGVDSGKLTASGCAGWISYNSLLATSADGHVETMAALETCASDPAFAAYNELWDWQGMVPEEHLRPYLQHDLCNLVEGCGQQAALPNPSWCTDSNGDQINFFELDESGSGSVSGSDIDDAGSRWDWRIAVGVCKIFETACLNADSENECANGADDCDGVSQECFDFAADFATGVPECNECNGGAGVTAAENVCVACKQMVAYLHETGCAATEGPTCSNVEVPDHDEVVNDLFNQGQPMIITCGMVAGAGFCASDLIAYSCPQTCGAIPGSSIAACTVASNYTSDASWILEGQYGISCTEGVLANVTEGVHVCSTQPAVALMCPESCAMAAWTATQVPTCADVAGTVDHDAVAIDLFANPEATCPALASHPNGYCAYDVIAYSCPTSCGAVPGSSPAACMAADNYAVDQNEFLVGQYGLNCSAASWVDCQSQPAIMLLCPASCDQPDPSSLLAEDEAFEGQRIIDVGQNASSEVQLTLFQFDCVAASCAEINDPNNEIAGCTAARASVEAATNEGKGSSGKENTTCTMICTISDDASCSAEGDRAAAAAAAAATAGSGSGEEVQDAVETRTRARRAGVSGSSNLMFVVASSTDDVVVLLSNASISINLATASGDLIAVTSAPGAQTVVVSVANTPTITIDALLALIAVAIGPQTGVIFQGGDEQAMFGVLVAVVAVAFLAFIISAFSALCCPGRGLCDCVRKSSAPRENSQVTMTDVV
jgi:hypothetical protein